MFLRQGGQGAAKMRLVLLQLHRGPGCCRLLVDEMIEGLRRRLRFAATQAVPGAVARDRHQPRRKFLRLTQFAPLIVRFKESVLDDFLGLGSVLQNSVGDDVDLPAVGADDRLERLFIPGQRGHDHDPLGGIHRGYARVGDGLGEYR